MRHGRFANGLRKVELTDNLGRVSSLHLRGDVPLREAIGDIWDASKLDDRRTATAYWFRCAASLPAAAMRLRSLSEPRGFYSVRIEEPTTMSIKIDRACRMTRHVPSAQAEILDSIPDELRRRLTAREPPMA